MTSKQKAYLRSLANTVSPIIQVGKQGVTPELTMSVEEALESKELIKISVLNNCTIDNISEIAETIAGRTRADVVQVIGKKIVLFRASKTKPEIKLPK
jgi:RNA-binding protein